MTTPSLVRQQQFKKVVDAFERMQSVDLAMKELSEKLKRAKEGKRENVFTLTETETTVS